MKHFYNIRTTNPWRGELTARMFITNKCYTHDTTNKKINSKL